MAGREQAIALSRSSQRWKGCWNKLEGVILQATVACLGISRPRGSPYHFTTSLSAIVAAASFSLSTSLDCCGKVTLISSPLHICVASSTPPLLRPKPTVGIFRGCTNLKIHITSQGGKKVCYEQDICVFIPSSHLSTVSLHRGKLSSK